MKQKFLIVYVNRDMTLSLFVFMCLRPEDCISHRSYVGRGMTSSIYLMMIDWSHTNENIHLYNLPKLVMIIQRMSLQDVHNSDLWRG